MSRIHYSQCPVCGQETLENVLQVKDYTVSGEIFAVAECGHCHLRLTQDVPDQASIIPYYKSQEYISHTNTATGLINRLYHFVRKRTLTKKRKLIQASVGKAKGNILDIGSGTGSFVDEMKINGWESTGLEPDADARQMARQLYGIDLLENEQLFRLAPGHFDAITMWHVLEHVHELQAYIRQIKELLADNGRLFIAVPNYTSKDASVYKEYWAAYDVPRHLYHFSPQSMQELMKKYGLSILRYQPMWYDSFYISMLSSKYKNGKTNWLAACWNGFRSNLLALGNTRKCSSLIYVIGKDRS